MSITWTATDQRRPDPGVNRVLALDRRTGYATVVWYEQTDEFGGGGWYAGADADPFNFTHWAPITLPM